MLTGLLLSVKTGHDVSAASIGVTLPTTVRLGESRGTAGQRCPPQGSCAVPPATCLQTVSLSAALCCCAHSLTTAS